MTDGHRVWKPRQRQRWQRYWNRHGRTYDREMAVLDRVLFRDTAGGSARRRGGQVLEVAIGAGLNIGHYPPRGDGAGVASGRNVAAR